jgi:histone H3/H4
LIEIDIFKITCRIQATALEALQEATEMYIVQFFEDAMLLSLHAKRVTLLQNDMILMRRLRGRDDIINR